MSDTTKSENIRKAKELWDRKQERKFKLVREQQERTKNRTPEQIAAQKERKEKRRLRKQAQSMEFES